MLTAGLVILFFASFFLSRDVLVAVPVLAAALLIVALMRPKAAGPPALGGTIAGLGLLLAVGYWYAQHYQPVPGTAGIIMKYSEQEELALALGALGNFLVFCIPIAGYGLGMAIRAGVSRMRRRRRHAY